MDFLQELGKVALGSRLRRLGEIFGADSSSLYKTYQVNIQPKWFPVFYLLSQNGESSITAMSKSIGCSHPVVSQTVKEMTKAELIETGKQKSDGRVNVVKLTDAGQKLIPNIENQMQDVLTAVDELLKQTQNDLWKAIEEVEFLLDEKSLYERVIEHRKQRESQTVQIIDYKEEFHEDFKRINYEWIEKYFRLEKADHESLDQPNEKILQPGGAILLAKYEDEIVGSIALLKKNNETFELVKMAVTPKAQGKNIGWLLGNAALERAKFLGAKKVFLESNTKLKPAINLYNKLGFTRVVGPPSPYERCNIQMEQILA